MGHHLRSNRIEDHIAEQLQQMSIFVDQDGREASLKEMSHPLMAAIERLCIAPIELPHALREMRAQRVENR